MADLTQICYAAGMVDGDGCIQITHRKDNGNGCYVVRVSIANASELVPLWFKRIFGGRVNKFIMSKERRQPSYRWTVEAKSALPFLTMIEPYLVEKKERAKLAIQYLEGVSRNNFKPLPDEIVKKRTEMFLEMKTLNSKHSRSYWNNLNPVTQKEI